MSKEDQEALLEQMRYELRRLKRENMQLKKRIGEINSLLKGIVAKIERKEEKWEH